MREPDGHRRGRHHRESPVRRERELHHQRHDHRTRDVATGQYGNGDSVAGADRRQSGQQHRLGERASRSPTCRSPSSALPAYTPGLAHVYQVEVRNQGPFTVRGATVSDTVPPGLAFGAVVRGRHATCHLPDGTGAADPSSTSSIWAPVPRFGTGSPCVRQSSGALTTCARSRCWRAGRRISDNNTAAVTSAAGARADLRVTKSGTPKPYIPGQALAYTLVVSNDGPSNVIGARVQDVVPSELTSATWTCTPSSGDVCASAAGTGHIDQLVTLPVGGRVAYRLSATVLAGATGFGWNTVTVTPPAGVDDQVPGNSSATDTNPQPPPADLTISNLPAPTPFCRVIR